MVPAELVRHLIRQHKVVIFSKTYCPYCNLAKETFQKMEVRPHIIELDKRKDCSDIQQYLKQVTGSRTVPQCFINGKCVGGGSDVKKLYDNGTLKKYLKELKTQ